MCVCVCIYDIILIFSLLLEIPLNFYDVIFVLLEYDSDRLNEISF